MDVAVPIAEMTQEERQPDKTVPAVKVIDVDLTSEEYAFGVDKNKPELLTQVNDFIKEIKDNGTFDETVTNILVAEIQHR